MNSDSTTAADNAEQPVKKVRRRVVRTAGTPTTPEPAAAAPAASQPLTTSAPQTSDRPALDVMAELAATAPPKRTRAATRPAKAPEPVEIAIPERTEPAERAERPARQRASRPAKAAPEQVAQGEEPTTSEAAPKKSTRSRRATKPAGEGVADAAGASAAQDAPAEQPAQADAAPKSRQRRSRAKVTEQQTLEAAAAEATATEEPTAEPAAEAPAPRSRRRRATAEAAPEAAEVADAEKVGAPAANAEPAAQERPARSRRSRGSRGPASTEDTSTPASEQGAPEAPAEATSEESEAAETPAKRPASRSRGGRSRKPATEASDAPEAPTADVATEAEADAAPAESGRASAAVLFQAPEATGRRTRRRVSAPAGPPEAVAPAVVDLESPADEDDEADTTDVTSPDDAAAIEATAAADAADGDTEESGDSDDSDEQGSAPRRRRRRGGRGRRSRSQSDSTEDTDSSDRDDDAQDDASDSSDESADSENDSNDNNGEDDEDGSSRRRRRRRRGSRSESDSPRSSSSGRTRAPSDEVTALKGSTRLEAKRQRRREGRDAGRRRSIITEAEFLARRESVERSMVVREQDGRTQIAVLEDGVLVEHYVSQQEQASMAGNVYLGRVQNVLPSMEAAFIDVGKGRNAVLYAGEVNWDAAGLEGQPRRIEQALKSGDSVLVQVTKDPIGHKGARLTSQVTLAGRYLVYVPGGGMTGISRKLPDTERSRLKKILRELVPDTAGVIVRTAAEGASEDELRADIARLQGQWEKIEKKAKTASAPALLQGEPDLAIRVVRDIFNDDFTSLVISGDSAWDEISGYVSQLAPDLAERVTKWTGTNDVFAEHRVDEQLAKGMDRKVWLPSGGSLVIDRTEAMTVVDVNTGKFTGSGGTLEETVTRNNIEAAEEIVRQLRLRDIGGIIVIDFIDMVLESNRDLVLRRLVECLGRDRTKHQVAEVTSLGLVQMTRKRVGQGLVEAFSSTCEHCNGRGFIVHSEPNEKPGGQPQQQSAPKGDSEKRSRRKRGAKDDVPANVPVVPVLPEAREAVKATLATIAAAAAHAHEHDDHPAPATPSADAVAEATEAGATDPKNSALVIDVLAELKRHEDEKSAPAPAVADDAAAAGEAPAPEAAPKKAPRRSTRAAGTGGRTTRAAGTSADASATDAPATEAPAEAGEAGVADAGAGAAQAARFPAGSSAGSSSDAGASEPVVEAGAPNPQD